MTWAAPLGDGGAQGSCELPRGPREHVRDSCVLPPSRLGGRTHDGKTQGEDLA